MAAPNSSAVLSFMFGRIILTCARGRSARDKSTATAMQRQPQPATPSDRQRKAAGHQTCSQLPVHSQHLLLQLPFVPPPVIWCSLHGWHGKLCSIRPFDNVYIPAQFHHHREVLRSPGNMTATNRPEKMMSRAIIIYDGSSRTCS